jgi:hypothetical protein
MILNWEFLRNQELFEALKNKKRQRKRATYAYQVKKVRPDF